MSKKVYKDYVTTTDATWTVKQFCDYADQGIVKFDNVIQRGYVWDTKQKSLLIHSLIVNFMPPEFVANRISGVYDIIDGKQRFDAISSFLHDEYALLDVDSLVSSDGVRYILNGRRFSGLEEEAQDKIMGRALKILVMENAPEEYVKEYFYRRNNGTTLSATRKTFSKAASFADIIEMANHPLFEIAFPKSKSGDENKGIVMKSYALLFADNKSLENKKVFQYVKNTKFSKEKIATVTEAYNTLHAAFKKLDEANTIDCKKVLKKVRAKTHLITLVYAANYVNETGIDIEIFVSWLLHFFGSEVGASISNVYNENAVKGSSKEAAINARTSEMRIDLKKFIK